MVEIDIEGKSEKECDEGKEREGKGRRATGGSLKAWGIKKAIRGPQSTEGGAIPSC